MSILKKYKQWKAALQTDHPNIVRAINIGEDFAKVTIGAIIGYKFAEYMAESNSASNKLPANTDSEIAALPESDSIEIVPLNVSSNGQEAESRDSSKSSQGRYTVEWLSYRTGEWYTKTQTDSKAGAFSTAKVGNYGRACRLTDTEIGEILFESAEDSGMKAVNGCVDKIPINQE